MIVSQILNLTPHSITIWNISILPEKEPLRVELDYEEIGSLTGIKCYNPIAVKDARKDEPERIDGTIYIVSNLTATVFFDREDFFIPRLVNKTPVGLILNPYLKQRTFRTEEEYSEILKLGAEDYKKRKAKIEKWDFTDEVELGMDGVCLNCWNSFTKKTKKSRYCSTKCGNTHRYKLRKELLLND